MAHYMYSVIQLDGPEKADERKTKNLLKLTLCTGSPRLTNAEHNKNGE